MSKKIKRKVIVSVVSLIIIFVLSMMISGYFEIINKWIPIIEDGYIINAEIYDFFLVACFIIIAFIIFLNFIIWFYEKLFKD